MNRWMRVIAPIAALAVVLAAGLAALGNGNASAKTAPSVKAPIAQQQPVATPEPTEVAGPETKDATEAPGTETPDAAEAAGTEAPNAAETPDSEAKDAAALASQATVTEQQAKDAALAANPGTTVAKASLGDENGTVAYSVELSNGADVKIDAKTGAILSTDQAGSDNEQAGDQNEHEGTDEPVAPAKP